MFFGDPSSFSFNHHVLSLSSGFSDARCATGFISRILRHAHLNGSNLTLQRRASNGDLSTLNFRPSTPNRVSALTSMRSANAKRCGSNFHRISTYDLLDLKPGRISTYEKRGEQETFRSREARQLPQFSLAGRLPRRASLHVAETCAEPTLALCRTGSPLE